MSDLSQSPTLVPEERAPSPPPRRAPREQLWLAVYLPDLALLAIEDAGCLDEPTAVVEPDGGQQRIVAASRAARRLGIEPGLTAGAAMALVGSLKLLQRSVLVERQSLESLAAWSERITPTVSLEAAAILLEVRGSLKFFSGLDGIKQVLGGELAKRRWRFRLSSAPTPLAALWLARTKSVDASTPGDLRRELMRLPLAATGWPDRVQTLLRSMGLSTVGECLRLPRGGLARRAGKRCLDELDRAMGRRPDLRLEFRKPQTLGWTVDFVTETADRNVFVHAVESGLARLAVQLRDGQAEIEEVEIVFRHPHAPATSTSFRFVEPVHDAARMLPPLLARLENVELGKPVTGLALRTGPLLPVRLGAADLFDRVGEKTPVAELALIERLRARFGVDGVHGLALEDEHRPEFAWSRLIDGLHRSAAAEAGPSCAERDRPLWILSAPRSLSAKERNPFGPSAAGNRFGPGPERIESGWWDGRDVRRDYYALTTSSGEKLWVFRDCTTHRWYLHGLFG